MRRLLIWLVLLVGFFGLFSFRPVLAESSQHPIYLFYRVSCPHCEKEREFLADLVLRHPDLVVKEYEIELDRDSRELFTKVVKVSPIPIRGVPVTIIGDQVFEGFYSAETTGVQIEQALNKCCEQDCPDLVAPFLSQQTELAGSITGNEECQENESNGLKINLPFIGSVDPTAYSLPVLTVLIAAVDGFNPCAMWVLLFLISLLLGVKDRKKMWLLGGTFIAASALVYFLFLTAWLQFFLFIGWIRWVRWLIGLVAVGSGVHHLREYWINKTGVCKTVKKDRKKMVVAKMRQVIQSRSLVLALLGMVVLAFGVNLIELVCSAGLPAIYTQVLSLSDLPQASYYGYLILYVIVFMLDDLFIFWVAMRTLQMTGISSKYSRISNLIGGVLIFLLGVLLIFKPAWIMFG